MYRYLYFHFLGINGQSANWSCIYVSFPIIKLVLRVGEHFLDFCQQLKVSFCFLQHLIFACPLVVAIIIVVVSHPFYGPDGL